MDDAGLAHEYHRLNELLCDEADGGECEASLVVLFEDLIEGDAQQLEYDAEVLAEDEEVKHFDNVVLVSGGEAGVTEEVENADLDDALVTVGWAIFDNLDGDLVGEPLLLALDDLAESTFPQKIQNHVILSLRRKDTLVDTQDVIILRVIHPIVQHAYLYKHLPSLGRVRARRGRPCPS